MRVFKVTGWQQYKTDVATKVERVQIARTAEDALEDAVTSIARDGVRYKLDVTEMSRG